MKKNYFIFGIIYCSIILGLFTGGMYIYLKDKIEEINYTCFSWFGSDYWQYENAFTEKGDIEIDIEYAVSGIQSENAYYLDNYGKYYAVIDTSDYSVIAQSGDFIEVRCYSDKQYTGRLLIPDKPLADSSTRDFFNFSGFENSKCDDFFIYDGEGTMTAHDVSVEVEPDHPAYINEDAGISFDEWIGEDSDVGFEIYYYDSSETKAKLNRRAEELSWDYIDFVKYGEIGEGEVLKVSGFFESKAVYIRSINKGSNLVVYSTVFSPFMTAVSQNKKIITVAFIIFLLIEGFTIFAVAILYRNQKSFELRSQKLTRGIAHELKTPLAVTKACVENWEYIDEKDRHEYSEKIISEVDHMASMITKLLELSKLNGGRNSINKEEVDVLKLTKTVYARMEELAKEKHLEVTISDHDGIGEYIAYADPEMMNIVIGNFISNAIKYSDTYIKMTVSDLGKKIEFRITNDGARIESKDLAKVWDVFYKTDEARTDRISSSGVGLAVVKSILDMHKAKYGCTSTYNSTTFFFVIDKAKEK